MSMDTPAGIAIVETTTSAAVERDRAGYVDWPAIFAGIVLAAALSLMLISFGPALGLNLVAFHAREGASPVLIGIAAASWLLWVQVSSVLPACYLPRRLRRRHFDA